MVGLQSKQFKIAFPGLTLPEQFGGKRALILYSAPHPQNPGVAIMASCLDIDGHFHPQVPLMIPAVLKAAEHPTWLHETTALDAPLHALLKTR